MIPAVFRLLLRLVLVSTVCDAAGVEITVPPNFVVIIADDLSWDDVGVYGNLAVRTPNIDALARAGLRFDNAFLTSASCSPSRASILTGRYPHTNGAMHLHQGLPLGEITIARSLRAAGYYTASVGKWHIGRYAKLDFDRVIEDNESASGAARWVEELRRRPRRRPFFFWLAAHDPHRDFDVAGEDLPAPYDPSSLRLPFGFVDGPGTRAELAAFYREVSRFDSYIGRVVSELRLQGVLDNTVLIVMSDNGRPFHLGKLSLYDEGIRTPFILHWPAGQGAPGVRAQLLSAVDIAPGILELAGLVPEPAIQGISFVPLIESESARIRNAVFAERNWHGSDAHERAIRTVRFLYKENRFPRHGHCRNSPFGASAAYQELAAAWQAGELSGWLADCFTARAPVAELYLVGQWSTDRVNVAGRPEYRPQLQVLRQRLRRWRAETGDLNFAPYMAYSAD